MYSVWRWGTSKPVSHISQTITSFNGSFTFLNRRSSCFASVSDWMISSKSSGLDITTATSGAFGIARMAWYISAAIFRVIVTIIALPSSPRLLKWLTMSAATCFTRSGVPTSSASFANLRFNTSLSGNAYSSAIVSNSSSIKLFVRWSGTSRPS